MASDIKRMTDSDEETTSQLTSDEKVHLKEEASLLEELESQIGEPPLVAETVSSFINSSTDSDEKTTIQLTDDEKALLNRIKQNFHNIFLTAVKQQKEDVADFLIKCGANVNATDEHGQSVVDYVWTNKNCKILLSLLQADSFFPTGFDLNALIEDDGHVKKIKKLVGARNQLHENIEKGDVEDVKNLILKDKSSKFYLNASNESAAFVALKHKKFDTYAYLKSIGAELGNDEEKSAVSSLMLEEKVALQEAMIQFFPPVPGAHILYLASKSRSQKPIDNLIEKLMNYYSELDKIPEISLIMKVIQFADYFDIVFDFDGKEISQVCPLAGRNTRGETKYKEGRIYIAANLERTEKKILGTIAHELTHMAMEILFENDCNPYKVSDEQSIDFFRDFKRRIRNDVKKILSDPSKILMYALDCYSNSDHDSELIVRIPQILVEFDNGRNWLEKNVPEFLKFYNEKVVPKCQQFINDNFYFKSRSLVKSINESIGEIMKLKKVHICFKNAPNIFENKDEQVFLYEAQSTLLGLLKVLQGLFGKFYGDSYNRYLVLNFENLANHLVKVGQAFFMEGSKWLIIEISCNPSQINLDDICEMIEYLKRVNGNKKVIFVVRTSVIKIFRDRLRQKRLPFEEVFDCKFSLHQLDEDSQKKILRMKIIFQGNEMRINQLIPFKELYELINPEIIESLLEGRKVSIGNNIPGSSSFEGPYSNIGLEMDFQSFVHQAQNSDDIFIVRSKPIAEVTDYFNNTFGENRINTKYLTVKSFEFEKRIDKERIFLVGEGFESENFKTFCRVNPEKKCCFVEIENLHENSFILIEHYNPDFYVGRKIRKIFLRANEMNELISENNSEIFIINGPKNADNLDNHSNVNSLNEEEVKSFVKSGGTVHWFHMEGEIFTWKNSSGSIKNLRKFIRKEKSGGGKDHSAENDLLLLEEDFISDIINRRVVIIADNPGTGKSTTLTKLYKAKPIADSHWIIRINLKDNLQAVKNKINTELDLVKVIKFLRQIEPQLDNDLNDNLLEMSLAPEKKFFKSLLLAFDGFDEILDEENRKNITRLFRFLKNETNCKIWITTRMQYRDHLEREMETFAIEFHPFDDEMTKSFVVKYFKDRSNLVLKEETFRQVFTEGSLISDFNNRLLLKMKEIFERDVNKFIGIPLKLQLVLPASLEYFKHLAEKGGKIVFDYLGCDLLEVYQNFIQKTYKIYFEKCKFLEMVRLNRDKDDSEKYNKDLAESLVYKREGLKPRNDCKELILLIGLIQSQNDENFEFIHFTFREYYFSDIFSDYILNETIPLSNKKMAFLFEEILAKQEFRMIRNFLNLQLKEKLKGKQLSEKKLEEFKEFFTQNDRIMKPYTTRDSLLTITGQQGYEYIFKFIYSVCIYIAYETPSLKITNILNRTLFRTLAISGHVVVWEVLLEILKDLNLSGKWQNFYYKYLLGESLALTAKAEDLESTKALLRKMEEFSKSEIRFIFEKFKIIRNLIESSDEAGILDSFLQMAEKVFSEKEQRELFIMTSTHEGPTSLHAAAIRKDPKFMELLLKKCDAMKPKDLFQLLMIKSSYYGGTILHKAAENGGLEICQLILDKCEVLPGVEYKEEFLMLENNRNFTAFTWAVRLNHWKIVELLIKKGEDIFDEFSIETFLVFLTIKNKENGTFRPLPISHESFESIKIFIEKGERMLSVEDMKKWLLTVDDSHRTVIHLACYFRNFEVLRFVLGILEKYLSFEEMRNSLMTCEKENQSCLHLAVAVRGLDLAKLIFDKIEKYLSSEDQRKLIMMKDIHERIILHEALRIDDFLTIFLMEKFSEILGPELKLFFRTVEHRNFFNSVVSKISIVSIEYLFMMYERLGIDDQYLEILTENTILHAAASNENPKVAELIFRKMEKMLTKKDLAKLVMTTDMYHQTCLHVAARLNKKGFITLFFEKMEKMLTVEELGKLMMKTDLYRQTCLHIAIRLNRKEFISLFFEKMDKMLTIKDQGMLMMKTDIYNQTCLHVAARLDRKECITLFFEKIEKVLTIEELGKLMMETDIYNHTCLHVAVTLNGEEFVTLFFEKIEKLLSRKHQCQLLLQRTYHGKSIFHNVVLNNEPNILEIFLQKMDEIFTFDEPREYILLRRDYTYGEIKVPNPIFNIEKHIEFFLNASIYDDLRIPVFQFSLRNNKSAILSLVLEKIRKLLTIKDQKNLIKEEIHHSIVSGTILHVVASFGYAELLDILLKYLEETLSLEGLRDILTMKSVEDQTPLHAILSSDFEVELKAVELLLEKLVKILMPDQLLKLFTAKDNSYRSPFHAAVLTKGLNIVELLFTKAENALCEDFDKVFTLIDDKLGTVLHAAIIIGNDPDVVKFLLTQGKRIRTPEMLGEVLMMTDKHNRTVLHLIARHFSTKLRPYGRKYNEEVFNTSLEFSELETKSDEEVFEGRLELLYIFLKEGERVLTPEKRIQFLRMQDQSGQTTLHSAIVCDKVEMEMVKLLLQAAQEYLQGENLPEFLMATDNNNITAIDMSNSSSNYFMKKLLTTFEPLI